MTLRPNQNLDQILEAVAVAAWDDLIHARTPGLVHVKYRLADNRSLADLQVWASETRGRWLLVCKYSPVASTAASPGLLFSNGYGSDVLAHFLRFVIEHQGVFDRSRELNRDSMVQVRLPNEDEKLRALKFVNEVQTLEVVHQQTAFAAAT